jgi:LAO/AO transport system kinase
MDDLASHVIAGDRRALARAITLVESSRPDHRAQALDLGDRLRATGRQALRIGLSGTPGVGKSTFIEAFGRHLTAQGQRVAVLAVDPTSARSGGSILGDKTRMPLLSRDPRAFIRPSPSQSALGGIARRTREVVAVCEGAGFDVVLVETVGVGQSETLVAGVTDVFLLLIAPAGGDELQGVKRGIMEIADIVLVNKADGALLPAAERTRADYQGALRLMRARPEDPPGYPMVKTASAAEGRGVAEAWQAICTLADWRRAHGHWAARRAAQATEAFSAGVREGILAAMGERPALRAAMRQMHDAVAAGQTSPERAADQVLRHLFG